MELNTKVSLLRAKAIADLAGSVESKLTERIFL